MSDDAIIREMTEADRDVWADMYAHLFPKSDRTAMYVEIQRILDAPLRSGYCIEIKDKVVGFAELNIREFANGCESQPVPFLEGIWIDPQSRKQGLARQLIDHLQLLIRAQGYNEFGSDVIIDDHPSLAMHKALGFEETERVVYFRKAL